MHIVTLPPHQLRQLARRKPIVYAEDTYWTPPKALPAISPSAQVSRSAHPVESPLPITMSDRAIAPPTGSWPATLVSAIMSRLFGNGPAQQNGAIRHWE